LPQFHFDICYSDDFVVGRPRGKDLV
jgi:hypothetical protein